jgi:hypothetical protein
MSRRATRRVPTSSSRPNTLLSVSLPISCRLQASIAQARGTCHLLTGTGLVTQDHDSLPLVDRYDNVEHHATDCLRVQSDDSTKYY